ncbi:MAG: protein of unknown function DUF1492 [Chaetfec virus UA24_244]|nr:MAG: protein of unknown function DUF1492 [Chaetfec virus UA24_244]
MIARLKSTVATLRSGLTSQSYELKPDKVQTSGPKDTIAETFSRIDELEREINQNIADLSNWKKEAYDRINRIPDFDQRNVLIARYIQGMKWEKVSVAINFSISRVYEIHGVALQNFVELNPDIFEIPE